MTFPYLFSPLDLGRYRLDHRVIMPPLTRMRATRNNVPNKLAAEYYSQRATQGGFMIAEATQATSSGQGYPATPGIYSDDQINAWKKITNAVHEKGGIIFLQIWHTGRASHSSFQPDGRLPVGPSPIAIESQSAVTIDGQKVAYEIPRALTLSEIPAIIEGFRNGAKNALDAGFDGVEVHGANGYLLEQFLHSRSNKREDIYGGSIENRCRLLLEVTNAVIDVWGCDRVGVRLSPFGTYNDVGDSDPIALYSYLLSQLQKLKLAYVHMIEARDGASMEIVSPNAIEQLRQYWPGVLILAGGFNANTAELSIRSGRADAIAFGRFFIANPDLPERLQIGAPLNSYDRSTFYGGGAHGYTDYPFLNRNQNTSIQA